MVYAVILAAGLGLRMHRQDMPKQFLPLGDKPIIIHTLEQFIVSNKIGHIVVVAPESWKRYAADMLEQYEIPGDNCRVISGGSNKAESIAMAVWHIDETRGILDGDVLIAHDAIRPFVTQRLIDEHIDAAVRYGAANTALLMNDSILESKDGKNLCDVPAFGRFFAEQTPQSYELQRLKDFLVKIKEDGVSLDTEPELPRLWVRYGMNMSLIKGEYFNMKIINPYDLEVANALLKERR